MSDETRGQAIKNRRLALGIKSLREFHEKTGVSREAITAAEAGEASRSTYERLETWLDSFDEETGGAADTEGQYVEFTLHGLYGARDVTVKGPVANMAELEQMVNRLLRGQSDGAE